MPDISIEPFQEGAYGTMPELYVRPEWQSQSVGKKLLDAAVAFAHKKGWHRIEVTTPPRPAFTSFQSRAGES